MKKSIKFSIGIFALILVTGCVKQQPVTLKDAYKDTFLIGTALNYNQIMGKEPATMELVKQQFNAVTAENAMKWSSIHPKLDEYNFEVGDSLVSLAQKNGMAVIGHTLVWHAQTPRWVFKDDSTDEPASRELGLKHMREHIQTVAGRYKGRILGWDVVNEAFGEDGKLHRSPWLSMIGEDYIQYAFQFAHEADPDAELYYNDFNMWYPGKVQGVVQMVEDLRSKGISIHGVGLQGHWGLDYPKLDEIEAAFQAFSDVGMKIMITEMDIDVLPQPGNYQGADISKNFALQKELNPYADALPDSMQQVLANRYAELFRIFYKYKDSVSRVTFWGVHDSMSWKNFFPVRGRTNYPLLFDRQLKPKPAFNAVIDIAKRSASR